MKTAILSINLHTRKLNYGAALHSWVFQKLMLRREDIETCEVIDYLPEWAERENPRMQYLKKLSIFHPKDALNRLQKTAAYRRRYDRFNAYFERHLIKTRQAYTKASLESARLPYDLVFLEGDVIWSPSYFGNSFDPVYFGAADSMKGIAKIAYAPSMSNAKLSPEHIEALRELLKYPDAISVREDYAAEIVRGLTDKPVAEVIDPVLLASPSDFDEVTAPKRPVEGEYLLLFFPTLAKKTVIDSARAYARARGLQLVEISDEVRPSGDYRVIADAGVEDFMALIRNASAVFTTSLHGVCLSMLFHRDFYAFRRGGGNYKTEALCRKFGFSQRFQEDDGFREQPPIDWNGVDALLERHRAQSMAWLDAAIRAAADRTQGGKAWIE